MHQGNRARQFDARIGARQGRGESDTARGRPGRASNDRLIPPYVRDVGDRPASVRPHPGRGGRAVTLPDASARQADGFTDPPPQCRDQRERRWHPWVAHVFGTRRVSASSSIRPYRTDPRTRRRSCISPNWAGRGSRGYRLGNAVSLGSCTARPVARSDLSITLSMSNRQIPVLPGLMARHNFTIRSNGRTAPGLSVGPCCWGGLPRGSVRVNGGPNGPMAGSSPPGLSGRARPSLSLRPCVPRPIVRPLCLEVLGCRTSEEAANRGLGSLTTGHAL